MGAANPGHFEDVTAAAGLDVYRTSHFSNGGSDTNAYRFSSTFTDLDRDGHPDLAIAGDFKTSQIFWNNGDGTFTDGTVAAGVGSDEDGMGTTVGDFDGDGRLDWFISALVDVPGEIDDHSGNRLYRNNGDRTFADQTDLGRRPRFRVGRGEPPFSTTTTTAISICLSPTVGRPRSPTNRTSTRTTTACLPTSPLPRALPTRPWDEACSSFDYDNDGDLDVFIVNHGAKPILYRNDGGNANDWLKIKLEGTASNRDGIGAFITVDPDADVVGDEMVREINAGSNFLSQNELMAHFGLGPSAGTIDLITIRLAKRGRASS